MRNKDSEGQNESQNKPAAEVALRESISTSQHTGILPNREGDGQDGGNQSVVGSSQNGNSSISPSSEQKQAATEISGADDKS